MARSARRATFLLPYKAQRAISLIIHELQCQIDAIFSLFSFLLTFGGWQGNHSVQNFMENSSLKIWRPENQGKVMKTAF